MTKNEVIAVLRSEVDALKSLGATSLYLFGSTVRDRVTIGSDVDLFIDYDAQRRFSLIELVGMKQHLEKKLGVCVDLTTRDSLDPLLRDRIEAAAEKVF